MAPTFSVTYSRTGDVHTIDTGKGTLGNIVVDNTGVAPEAQGGTAKQLLGSAALFCYCANLAGTMDARGIKYEKIEATGTLHMGFNEAGQGRVRKMTIDAKVIGLVADSPDAFDRVQKIMKQGCLVTGSLHEGIEMEYLLSA